MFNLDLEKAKEPKIKLPTSIGSSKKQESSRKMSILLYWLRQSLWLCGSQQTGKFFKRWGYQTTLPASWEIFMQVKKQHLELDMEQWNNGLVLSWERSTSKLYIVTLLIYFICRVHHAKCGAGWITSWNRDCQEKYQKTKICKWCYSNGKKLRTKAPLDAGERGDWKSWLKTQHLKN